MSSLPNELVDEILCRLPVKPLLRFRRVSKEWCSLIDSTAFVKKNLNKALECNIGGGIIIKGSGDDFYLADFDSLDDASASVVRIDDPIQTLLTGCHFVGALNGLICVFKTETDDVFLFNPATRKSRKIAASPPEFPSTFTQFESCMFGFGYDELHDDYKVVKIAECYSKYRGIIAFAYSLKTNAWTRIQDVPSNIRFSSNRGIFASGSLHWTAIRNPGNSNRGIFASGSTAIRIPGNCQEIILGFDLELQQFKEVPFPPVKCAPVNFNIKCLVAVGGCLCFTDNYPNSYLDVWLMKGYGAQYTWYKALTMKQHSALGSFESFSPIAFSKSHKDVLLLEVDEKKLVWYDLDKKTVKKVKMCGFPVECNSFIYAESLLQLSEDKPLQQKPLKQNPPKDKKEKNQTKRRDEFLSKGFSLRL